MAMPAKKIAENKLLAGLFTNQFNVRMNNGKKYSSKEIIDCLKGLAD
jgi:hypothetical protein